MIYHGRVACTHARFGQRTRTRPCLGIPVAARIPTHLWGTKSRNGLQSKCSRVLTRKGLNQLSYDGFRVTFSLWYEPPDDSNQFQDGRSSYSPCDLSSCGTVDKRPRNSVCLQHAVFIVRVHVLMVSTSRFICNATVDGSCRFKRRVVCTSNMHSCTSMREQGPAYIFSRRSLTWRDDACTSLNIDNSMMCFGSNGTTQR